MVLPEITLGHFFYVLTWALLGVTISAVAWSEGRRPTYKEILASTLGISFEALGVELTRGQQALILPLLIVLVLALAIRYLPEESQMLSFSSKGQQFIGRILAIFLIMIFFLVQSTI